jgi:hypothetical protein
LTGKPGVISKILLGNDKDLRYHLAYIAYSKAWDENNNDEAREKLNDLINKLSDNEIDQRTFYYELNRFRNKTEYRSHKTIKSQRKRAWRQKEAKRSRYQRHK